MKFASQSIEEHSEVPLADEGRWETIIEHFAQRHHEPQRRDVAGTRCYAVCVTLGADRRPSKGRYRELLSLVRAQGDHVVGDERHGLERPDPRTFLGRGLAEDIAERAVACDAQMLVVDGELSPSQTRNLEDVVGLPICDREAVILNVFLRHAHTRRAKIQVEIAHLEYLRPRIRGLGLNMDQQAGGVMRARGPGETASELMARQLDRRLSDLKSTLGRVMRASSQQRHGRQHCRRVALVGYTNAGKTSLMNGITNAGLTARDMVFETLDTTSRCIARHGGDVLLSDTVGFIRDLPNRLLASFESTLAEVCDATLVAIVVDGSDPEWRLHLNTTHHHLRVLGAGDRPRLYILNKRDAWPEQHTLDTFATVIGNHPIAVISCHDEANVRDLKERLIDLARGEDVMARVFVSYNSANAMAIVHRDCRVLATEPKQHGMRLTLEAPPRTIAQLRRESAHRSPEPSEGSTP